MKKVGAFIWQKPLHTIADIKKGGMSLLFVCSKCYSSSLGFPSPSM